jgi:hypothetical protein
MITRRNTLLDCHKSFVDDISLECDEFPTTIFKTHSGDRTPLAATQLGAVLAETAPWARNELSQIPQIVLLVLRRGQPPQF